MRLIRYRYARLYSLQPKPFKASKSGFTHMAGLCRVYLFVKPEIGNLYA
jgi:hypothetical protein